MRSSRYVVAYREYVTAQASKDHHVRPRLVAACK